nr:NAD(P)H-hydrate dehydratase [Rubellimicrobium arenae]
MTAILTAAEMRALEQEAIARGEVTGLELMERAGRGVVEAILAEWPAIEQGPRRAVVLCGPGNNGGDGFVVARLLRERGWKIRVFLLGDAEKLPQDARTNYDRWVAMAGVLPEWVVARGSKPLTIVEPLSLETQHDPWDYSLIIDAVFGTGLTRPIDFDHGLGTYLPAWDLRFEPARPRVVAVDVPSGICSDSGRSLDGDTLWADLTVTFHRAKRSHFLAEGPFQCGRVVVKDIGLRERSTSVPTLSTTGQGLGGWVLYPSEPRDRSVKPCELIDGPKRGLGKGDRFGRPTHKYSHGHALILSGRPGHGGAARMTARGALRIGAGLVTLAVPPAALQENAARLDAIMLRSIKDAEALTDLLSDARYNALAVGPGLGTSDREAALLSAVLDASRATGEGERFRAVVLDADALTLLSRDDALRAKLHAACVLTPHEGEFGRLFPAIAEKWHAPAATGPAYSKVDATRDAAKECGAVVLLKGPDTVIADPTGRAAINAAVYDRAAPWLATAGSGDVLAGFVAGLLARGFAPFDAACTAAWLHVECARSFGPGLIAEDLPEELPKVFRALGL